MAGDGGNDCGGLRAAHAGLALSDAEARGKLRREEMKRVSKNNTSYILIELFYFPFFLRRIVLFNDLMIL